MTGDMAHPCRADLDTWQTGTGELFSVGGLLARWWRTEPAWLPWAAAAVVLLVAACWDPLVRGAQADFILIGLAGYEMVIGLTEE